MANSKKKAYPKRTLESKLKTKSSRRTKEDQLRISVESMENHKINLKMIQTECIHPRIKMKNSNLT